MQKRAASVGVVAPLFAVLFFVAGCGGQSAGSDPGAPTPGAPDGGTPDDAEPALPLIDGAIPVVPVPVNDPKCPQAMPADGAACTAVLSCSYASGVHGECAVKASCASATGSAPFAWSLTKTGAECAGNAATCPSTFASLAKGAACPGTSDLVCDYTEGRCGCSPCQAPGGGQGGGSSADWACRAWTDVAPGCPADAPNVGSACTTEGLECDYGQTCGGVSLGTSVACADRTWEPVVSAGACILRICGM